MQIHIQFIQAYAIRIPDGAVFVELAFYGSNLSPLFPLNPTILGFSQVLQVGQSTYTDSLTRNCFCGAPSEMHSMLALNCELAE